MEDLENEQQKAFKAAFFEKHPELSVVSREGLLNPYEFDFVVNTKAGTRWLVSAERICPAVENYNIERYQIKENLSEILNYFRELKVNFRSKKEFGIVIDSLGFEQSYIEGLFKKHNVDSDESCLEVSSKYCGGPEVELKMVLSRTTQGGDKFKVIHQQNCIFPLNDLERIRVLMGLKIVCDYK